MRRVISAGLTLALLVAVAVGVGDLKPAPIRAVDVFHRKCSNCHGKEGSMLERGFEQKYASASELREVVESMPGAIGMRTDELETMVAYMRAISRGEPFLIWTVRGATAIEGEVSPDDSKVQARAKGQGLKVVRAAANRWRVELPRGVSLEDVEITAQRGASRTTLRLREAPYSHTK
ncbi:MAG: hypothetical protein P3X24_003605 [bacterium]|nr:hypothetical protein [bacterium]